MRKIKEGRNDKRMERKWTESGRRQQRREGGENEYREGGSYEGTEDSDKGFDIAGGVRNLETVRGRERIMSEVRRSGQGDSRRDGERGRGGGIRTVTTASPSALL